MGWEIKINVNGKILPMTCTGDHGIEDLQFKDANSPRPMEAAALWVPKSGSLGWGEIKWPIEVVLFEDAKRESVAGAQEYLKHCAYQFKMVRGNIST